VTLLGRFMRESKREYACKLHDISVGGAAIFTPIEVDVGERVVAYFDFVGGIEGGVVRVFDGGFAFKIQATQHKREKMAAQLTWLANRCELAGVEERKHERLAPKQSTSSLHLGEGITVNCRVLDVSISGASVASSARPVIGTEVLLGKMRALVVRHHDEGFCVLSISKILPRCATALCVTTPTRQNPDRSIATRAEGLTRPAVKLCGREGICQLY
jgi:PilZ domain